jgi:hypothetical protein
MTVQLLQSTINSNKILSQTIGFKVKEVRILGLVKG